MTRITSQKHFRMVFSMALTLAGLLTLSLLAQPTSVEEPDVDQAEAPELTEEAEKAIERGLQSL